MPRPWIACRCVDTKGRRSLLRPARQVRTDEPPPIHRLPLPLAVLAPEPGPLPAHLATAAEYRPAVLPWVIAVGPLARKGDVRQRHHQRGLARAVSRDLRVRDRVPVEPRPGGAGLQEQLQRVRSLLPLQAARPL